MEKFWKNRAANRIRSGACAAGMGRGGAAAALFCAAALLFAPSAAAAPPAGGAALVPMGDAVGLSIECEGVMVTGTREEDGAGGSPAAAAGIEPGDIIVRVGESGVRSGEDLRRALAGLTGAPVEVRVTRAGREMSYTVAPSREPDGSYRLGLAVRDMLTGIGTLTFYDPATGQFGALGHSAGDADTGTVLPIRDGVIANTTITGVVRGRADSPGQLQGAFDAEGAIGRLQLNTLRGIFGVMLDDGTVKERLPIPVGAASDIKTGAATILSTVSGSETREYGVEITRVYADAGQSQRGLMLTVKDPSLIEQTGGIVQGMSGSPIIQDGKLVGAVTHVLVGDPTRGYGISIESMLAAAGKAPQGERTTLQEAA